MFTPFFFTFVCPVLSDVCSIFTVMEIQATLWWVGPVFLLPAPPNRMFFFFYATLPLPPLSFYWHLPPSQVYRQYIQPVLLTCFCQFPFFFFSPPYQKALNRVIIISTGLRKAFLFPNIPPPLFPLAFPPFLSSAHPTPPFSPPFFPPPPQDDTVLLTFDLSAFFIVPFLFVGFPLDGLTHACSTLEFSLSPISSPLCGWHFEGIAYFDPPLHFLQFFFPSCLFQQSI